jgi:hypothetical protein
MRKTLQQYVLKYEGHTHTITQLHPAKQGPGNELRPLNRPRLNSHHDLVGTEACPCLGVHFVLWMINIFCHGLYVDICFRAPWPILVV